MRISYFRTAYVMEVGAEMLDLIQHVFNPWAKGNETLCIQFDDLTEQYEEYKGIDKKALPLHQRFLPLVDFIKKVLDKIKDDNDSEPIGDIVFSK